MNTDNLLTQVGDDKEMGVILRDYRTHYTAALLFRLGLITRKNYLKRKRRIFRQWKRISKP